MDQYIIEILNIIVGYLSQLLINKEYQIEMIGRQLKMIIYGEILQIEMKLDNDHVQVDGMCLVWRNGVEQWHIGRHDLETES
jgi:hypothetical protein